MIEAAILIVVTVIMVFVIFAVGMLVGANLVKVMPAPKEEEDDE